MSELKKIKENAESRLGPYKLSDNNINNIIAALTMAKGLFGNSRIMLYVFLRSQGAKTLGQALDMLEKREIEQGHMERLVRQGYFSHDFELKFAKKGYPEFLVELYSVLN